MKNRLPWILLFCFLVMGASTVGFMTIRSQSWGEVSTNNSTTTPLAGGATFTGTGEQLFYPQVGVMLKTDADGMLFFDFSNDGTNWDSTFPVDGFVVSANVPEFHTAVKLGRYFRVRLVNGASAQTFLRLSTYYGNNFVPSVAPLNQTLSLDTDAISVRPTNVDDEISIGRRSGVTDFSKFCHNDNLSAAAGNETVWALSGTNHTIQSVSSTYNISYNNTTDGSGQTGATQLTFFYIDENGLDATATHVLGSTGSDNTSFSGLGINRLVVTANGGATYNVNDITVTENSGSTVQALIPATDSITQQCIFYTDANSDALGKFLWINLNKTSGGSSPKVTVYGYVYNRENNTRYEVFRQKVDTSVENTQPLEPVVDFKLEPKTVLYFEADTDTNGTVINMRFSIREYKRD